MVYLSLARINHIVLKLVIFRLDKAKRLTEAASIRYVPSPKGSKSSKKTSPESGAMIHNSMGGPGNQVNVYVDNGNYSQKSLSGNLPSLHSPRNPRNYRQVRAFRKPPPKQKINQKFLSCNDLCLSLVWGTLLIFALIHHIKFISVF